MSEGTVNEHRSGVLARYFKEVIYGGIDGIITTFAVVAGFSGAALSSDVTTQLSFMVVLLFGLANLFADATSMGLGNFLSVRSEQDLYNAKREAEQQALRSVPDLEFRETVSILVGKGFSAEDAATIANLYRHNEEYWLDFMMMHEHEESDPRGEQPIYTGLATFLSFIIFGSIPLLPFLFNTTGDAGLAFMYSVGGTFAALVTLGLLKWRVIGAELWPSLTEVLLVGGVAAAIAYTVGTFFSI